MTKRKKGMDAEEMRISVKRMNIFTVANKVRDEAFLENQLQMAGSNQARVIERLEKSKNATKTQAMVLKIVYGFMLGILPLLPVLAFVQVNALLAGSIVSVETIAFISISLLGIYFGMVAMYMLILGMLSVSGFMSGEVFRWVEVLPIPRKMLERVGFVVIWRFFDIPIIVGIAMLPTLMLLLTGNIIFFFTCLAASFVNVFFFFFIIIILAEKLNRILKGGATNSRKASVIRMIAMFGYIIVLLTTGLVLNVVLRSIGPIIAGLATVNDANANIINLLVSMIPFPFSTCYLLVLAMLPQGSIPVPLIATTSVGLVLAGILLWALYHRVLVKMRNLTSHDAKISSIDDKELAARAPVRDIKPVAPIKAYIRKDLTTLTRDFQGAISLFMPIVLPFIIFLPAAQGFQSMTGIALYEYLLIFLMTLTVMTAAILVTGILGMEESGASIIASLPIVPRDVVKAKLRIICVVQLMSSLMPLILVFGVPASQFLVPFYIAYCLVSVASMLLMFALKVRLFGKLRYKYVLEEVNVQGKAFKWIAIIIGGSAFIAILFLPITFLGNLLSPLGIAMLVVLIGGCELIVMLVVLHKMFPEIRGK